MIIGIGTDIVPVERVRETLERYGERFARKIFTGAERTFCETSARRIEHFAARFAAKEAFAKAVGTGITGETPWLEIEVVRLVSGQPMIQLHGQLAERWKGCRLHLSLSHSAEYAVAFVVIETSSE